MRHCSVAANRDEGPTTNIANQGGRGPTRIRLKVEVIRKRTTNHHVICLIDFVDDNIAAG